MKKVVIGVSGALTDHKDRIMRERLQPHFEGYEIVLIPFMNGSLIVPEDPINVRDKGFYGEGDIMLLKSQLKNRESIK